MSFINAADKKIPFKGNVVVPTTTEQKRATETKVPETKNTITNGKAKRSKSKREEKKKEIYIKRFRKADKLRKTG